MRHPPLGIMADMLYYTSDGTEFNLPKLMAANIRTLELNYLGSFGQHWQINASVFQNNLQNLISQYIFTDPADSSSLYFTGNVGKIKTMGAELGIDFQIKQKLKTSISGIYQLSENLEEGYEDISIAYSPPLLLYFKQFWQINKYLSLAFTANYVDKMLAEYNKVSNNRIGKETDAFYLINAQLGIQDLPFKNLNWSFKVNNLLDAEVHYPATTLNTFADLGLLGNPRMYFVKLSYTILVD